MARGRPALDKSLRRRHTLKTKVNDGELERIRERAAALGMGMAEFLREQALSGRNERARMAEREGRELRKRPPTSIPPTRVDRAAEAARAVKGFNRGAAIVADADRVEQEVAESKMVDDEARDAFLERRTRELHGQGRTTMVARREAEAEWRNRG